MRKKVLLMAYAVSPYRGSEYSLGWNFATRMSAINDVVVICGTSGDFFGDTIDLERFLERYQNPHLRFVFVRPSLAVRFFNYFNKLGFGPAFYVAFKFWHRDALSVAEKLCTESTFDVVHQLGPIGFREPGYLWRLGRPFVWGPIGGAQFVDTRLLRNLPFSASLIFRIKNLGNYLQLRFPGRVRQAAEAASVLVFATQENRSNFEKFLGKTGQIISELACVAHGETGHTSSLEAAGGISHEGGTSLRLVWCGQISSRKNLHFLLTALARVPSRERWTLTVIGDGPIQPRLEKLSFGLGISENIHWAGRHSRDEAVRLMRGSDLHVMCSLSEANTSVFYEATDTGIPTLALDRDGMSSELRFGNGILVPIEDYESTVDCYAKNIEELIQHPIKLLELKRATRSMLSHFSWDRKIAVFDDIYCDVIERQTGAQNA